MIPVISIAPASDPRIEPSPPDSVPPPMTTAAMTSSSSPLATVGPPTVSRENCIRPAMPASAADNAYTWVFTRCACTPHRRAVSSFDPIAKICRPNRV